MTDPHDNDYDDSEAPADKPTVYEVYNPDQTVGVACDRDGAVVGLHISDDVLDHGDTWVAAEVMKVAKLAHQKSRVALREEMERNGTDAFTLTSFGLPTQADYLAMERDEFHLPQASTNGHAANGYRG